jgi:4-methylaminobutanoate oxidase (formaldehyde-forming)
MALAEWILNGHAPRDLVDVDVRRVLPHQANRDYLLKRGPETLCETYAMHWPYKQRQSMRGLRRSPIHEQLKQAGAVFGESAGWERPMWFAPEDVTAEYEYGYNKTTWFRHWENEHQAIRKDVGLVDLSPFCKILVEGDDAEKVLQRICTNNVAGNPGRVVYTQWLNERAGIEADVTVARLSETRYLIMTSAATGLAELRWLHKHTPDDSPLAITDISTSQAAFGISGPRARSLLSAYTSADLSTPAFPFSTSQEISIGPVPVRAQRISYSGELGWELFVDSSFAPYLFELLMSGEKAKAPELVGFHAAESLRTEKAYRHWGHDIGYTDTPYESGLMFASKFDKAGGFIGDAALVKRVAEGSDRILMQFLLDQTPHFIYHNEPIFLNDQLVGSITTGTYGHTFSAPVGLGWITVPSSVSRNTLEDQRWEILVSGNRIKARASLKPLYDPQNQNLRN